MSEVLATVVWARGVISWQLMREKIDNPFEVMNFYDECP